MSFPIYGQRDPRWANDKLGFSTTSTIGNYGCTISCVAMLANLTPKEVNDRLKAVKGFQNDLILWQKINEAIPWLKWEWRGYTYENGKVLQAIKDNGACLVEVNASRIGAVRHWVLYVGNQKMYDPWYGNEKATSYYAPIGYSIIKVIGTKPEDSMSKELEACQRDRLKFWNERDELLRALGAGDVEGGKSTIAGYKSRITDLTNQLGSAQATAKNEKERAGRIADELLRANDKIDLLDTQANSLSLELERISREKGLQAIELAQAKEQIITLKEQVSEGEITLTIKDLFSLLWNHKITIKRG